PRGRAAAGRGAPCGGDAGRAHPASGGGRLLARARRPSRGSAGAPGGGGLRAPGRRLGGERPPLRAGGPPRVGPAAPARRAPPPAALSSRFPSGWGVQGGAPALLRLKVSPVREKQRGSPPMASAGWLNAAVRLAPWLLLGAYAVLAAGAFSARARLYLLFPVL